MASDGTRRQRITPERMDVTWAVAAARADVIVVETSEDLGAKRRLWRMDSNGGGLAELPGDGTVSIDELSPDGTHFYYRKRAATGPALPGFWRRPIAGGTEKNEEQVGDRPPSFSPDGRLFYRLINRTSATKARQIEIGDVATGRVIRTITDPSDMSNLRWSPSSDAVLGILRPDNVLNIWRLPIDGGPATQLTRFGPDQLLPIFVYTADGKLLFLRPERAYGEVVQFRNFR
jgi:Tol biopolymer transport system component